MTSASIPSPGRAGEPASPSIPVGVTEIDARTLSAWLQSGNAQLFDVREPDEHARERIDGATLTPLSRLNPRSLRLGPSKRAVFHCKGGRRSMEAASRVAAELGIGVVSLGGGIDAWKLAGLPVVTNAAAPRISIMRQVQLVVGVLLIIGTTLSAAVSPWWLVIPGFLGVGLSFAGASGFCGLAVLLGFMPWNRGVAGTTCSP